MSCQKTATKCTPVMAWYTGTQDDTSVNAVSSPQTLPLMSQQPHCRLLPDLPFLHHCLHPSSLHNCHSLCPLHLQHLRLQTTDTSFPEVVPVPAPMSVTPSIAPMQPCRLGCACTAPKHLIQELQPPYSPQEENPDPECPQTVSSLECVPRQRPVNPMHMLQSNVNMFICSCSLPRMPLPD